MKRPAKLCYRALAAMGLLCVSFVWFSGPSTADDMTRRLPDGLTASSGGMRAWYVGPTERYRHGILGDVTEASGLAVEWGGTTYMLQLDGNSVFEDIQPRLRDLTGDGIPEIITIHSDLRRGARVAVYRLTEGALSLYTASAHIGRPHRWLNIAAIRDLDGNGQIDIAWVETPHIGGILKVATVRSGTLTPFASLSGVSNHVIGSRNLCLAVVTDNGLVLPSQNYDALVSITVTPGALSLASRIAQRIDPQRPLTRQVGGITALTDPACVQGR